jgi:MFS superfamily sulfate permease-like transporter
MITILTNLLIILVIIAVLYLILYLFSKYVVPLDNRIVGIIIFIVAALLIVYSITKGGIWLK